MGRVCDTDKVDDGPSRIIRLQEASHRRTAVYHWLPIILAQFSLASQMFVLEVFVERPPHRCSENHIPNRAVAAQLAEHLKVLER